MLQQQHILYWCVKCLLLTVETPVFIKKGWNLLVSYLETLFVVIHCRDEIVSSTCVFALGQNVTDIHFVGGNKYFIAIFFFIYECWNWTNWKVISILVNDIEQHRNLRNLTLLFNGPQSQKKNHFFGLIRANCKPPFQMQVGWSDADVEGPWKGETRKPPSRRSRAARLDPRPRVHISADTVGRTVNVAFIGRAARLHWHWSELTLSRQYLCSDSKVEKPTWRRFLFLF